MVGLNVGGISVGARVGFFDGTGDGATVGGKVFLLVGSNEGTADGSGVGALAT